MLESDPYLFKAFTSKPCPNNNYNDDDNNTFNNLLRSTSLVRSEQFYKPPFYFFDLVENLMVQNTRNDWLGCAMDFKLIFVNNVLV